MDPERSVEELASELSRITADWERAMRDQPYRPTRRRRWRGL